MLNLIASVVTHIGEASDRESLSRVIQSALQRLGFNGFHLSCSKPTIKQLVSEPSLTTWPAEGIAEYESMFALDEDPLLTYVSSPGRPKVWSISEWQTPQRHQYARFLADRGVLSGVTAPLVHKPGSISVITAVSSEAETARDETATAVYVIGQASLIRMMSVGHTVPVTDRATEPPLVVADLTPDQLEILHWARQGKSNGDIALITGRSKRTVAYHMSQILQKLGVSTRAQAIALHSGK